MKKNVLYLFLTGLSFLLLSAGGCAVQENMLANSDKIDGPVVIGALLPMTGKNSAAGERMLTGLRYAEFEINNRRGIGGRQMKLVVFDTGSTAAGAAAAFKEAAQGGASGVIAGYSTIEAEAIAPLAGQFRIPSILAMATSDEVDPNPFIVRSAYTDRQQSEGLAAYLWYWRQLIRISVLIDADPDSRYERNTARATAAAFKALGGAVTSTPHYTGDNWEKALQEALITGPQAVIISAGGAKAARMIRHLRQKGYAGAVCGLDAWDDPAFFRELNKMDDPGDCVYVSFFTPQSKTEEFKDFKMGFRQKYFHEPGSCETMSYDALKLLAIGLSRARTLNEFTRNWLGIRNHFGASATYTMLPNGGIDRTVFVNAVDPKQPDGRSSCGRFIRSFMYSKLASYRY